MKVGQLLMYVAIIGSALGGLVMTARAIRGNQHWIMAVEDRPDGMILRIGIAVEQIPKSIESPDFVVRVKGHRLGRDLGPFLLDGANNRLPDGIARTFVDTTKLPGRCRLTIGPLFLDFCSDWLEANGKPCNVGETIEIKVAEVSVDKQAQPIPP